MEIKRKFFIYFIGIMAVFVLPFPAIAASLRMSPTGGNFQTGQTFTAQVVLDGSGQAFNAAKATVIVSPSLKIQSVTIGNCGFAFVKTPTITDPSFAGAILGGSSTVCTVETLTLQGISGGVGSITLLNGSVKARVHATEILSSTNNAAYTIIGSAVQPQTTPTQAPLLSPEGVKLYTLIVNVTLPQNIPLSSLQVVLDAHMPTQQTLTPSDATALTKPFIFYNVPQGTHTITLLSSGQPVSQQIAQVSGPDRTLVLGLSTTTNARPWLIYVLIALGVLFVIALGLTLYRKFQKKTIQNKLPPVDKNVFSQKT